MVNAQKCIGDVLLDIFMLLELKLTRIALSNPTSATALAYYLVASFPGPFLRGGEKRAWYTLHAHAPGTPAKSGVIVYYIVYSFVIRHLYTFSGYYIRSILGSLRCIDPLANGNHGDLAHARAMCTRPFSLHPSKKGPGNEASYLVEQSPLLCL